MKINLAVFLCSLSLFVISTKPTHETKFHTKKKLKSNPDKKLLNAYSDFEPEVFFKNPKKRTNRMKPTNKNPKAAKEMFKYSFPSFQWNQLDIPMLPRKGHSITHVNGNLYLFGGCFNETLCFNDLYVFDTKLKSWDKIPLQGDIPSPRRFHSAVEFGYQLIIYGGESSTGLKNDLYSFDTTTGRWTHIHLPEGPLTKIGISGHGVVAYNDTLIIFGGYTEVGYSNRLYKINLSNKEVELIETAGQSPSSREKFSFNIIENIAYLFGGFQEGGALNDLYTLNLTSNEWERINQKEPIPNPIEGMTSIALGHKIYLFGGCDNRKRECYSNLYVLSTLNKDFKWTEIKDERSDLDGREGASLGFVRGNLVLFGGCDINQKSVGKTHMMNIDNICPGECSLRGKCSVFGCICLDGFYGNHCEHKMRCRDDCNGHGRCMSSGICECEDWFTGINCEINLRCKRNCTNELHGVCDEEKGRCVCKEGFKGDDCGQIASEDEIAEVPESSGKNNTKNDDLDDLIVTVHEEILEANLGVMNMIQKDDAKQSTKKGFSFYLVYSCIGIFVLVSMCYIVQYFLKKTKRENDKSDEEENKGLITDEIHN